MATAYILLTTKSGMEQRVAEELALLDFVESTDLVYGEYDVVLKINADDVSKLTAIILDKIRKINGVERTSTLIVAKE